MNKKELHNIEFITKYKSDELFNISMCFLHLHHRYKKLSNEIKNKKVEDIDSLIIAEKHLLDKLCDIYKHNIDFKKIKADLEGVEE
jgi:hypothetical protein